jgi:hypothetical protein
MSNKLPDIQVIVIKKWKFSQKTLVLDGIRYRRDVGFLIKSPRGYCNVTTC